MAMRKEDTLQTSLSAAASAATALSTSLSVCTAVTATLRRTTAPSFRLHGKKPRPGQGHTGSRDRLPPNRTVCSVHPEADKSSVCKRHWRPASGTELVTQKCKQSRAGLGIVP